MISFPDSTSSPGARVRVRSRTKAVVFSYKQGAQARGTSKAHKQGVQARGTQELRGVTKSPKHSCSSFFALHRGATSCSLDSYCTTALLHYCTTALLYYSSASIYIEQRTKLIIALCWNIRILVVASAVASIVVLH